MPKLSTYTLLVMDYSTGRAFTMNVTKPVEDDFEEHVDEKLTQMGFRMKDCDWMEFTDKEVEDLTNE
jgi:hypothetical protein